VEREGRIEKCVEDRAKAGPSHKTSTRLFIDGHQTRTGEDTERTDERMMDREPDRQTDRESEKACTATNPIFGGSRAKDRQTERQTDR